MICNPNSWPKIHNMLDTENSFEIVINWYGLSSFLQDLATSVDLIGLGMESVFIGYGCVTAGLPGCFSGVVAGNIVWVGTGLNSIETGLSLASAGATLIADYSDGGGFGEATHTSIGTAVVGLISTDPIVDFLIDGYASGYNHGVFCGVDTILDCFGSP